MDPVWFLKKTNIFKMEFRELMKSVYLVWYLGDLWKTYIHIQEDWDTNNTKI